MFVLGLDTTTLEKDYGGAKCPKFNIVGPEEIDNLSLAKLIAEIQGKQLNYELVDFHSQRPGHDLRYAMSGEYLKSLGWEPRIKLSDRLKEVVEWSLNNTLWLYK
jgi:dTDP-glucose 4,6-dehydratase